MTESFRLFLSLFILASLVLSSAYKGNLLASLVRVEYLPPIDTSEVKCFRKHLG